MTYDKANRLVTYNGEEVRYDADGNMTYGPLNGQMVTFTYDCRNRLTRAGDTLYEYDAEDTRTAKQTPSDRTEYIVDKEAEYSQILQEKRTDLSTGQAELKRYVYGNGLIGKSDEAGYHIYHFDHTGSTTLMTNLAGEIENRYTYDTYGNLTSGNDAGNSFLYNGMYGVQTDHNGLYYMRARYYNITIKRFVNRDIVTGNITNSQSLNRYCYVEGNPVNLTDPFGLSPQKQEGFWSKAGHSLLNLLGFVPGIGDLADVGNTLWYLAEKDYANATASLISAVPAAGSLLGNGLRLGFKTSVRVQKGTKLLESVTHIVGAGATAVRGVTSGSQRIGRLYQNYKNGKGVDTNELLGLGLDVLTTAVSAKSIKANLNSAFALKNAVVKSADGKGNLMPVNLQYFAKKTPSQIAKSWQGSGKYPGIDNYKDITLNKGKVIYRGEPNGTEYFTTISAIDRSDRNATTIFEGLQVEKNPIHGYRKSMQGYMVNENVTAAFGITRANPQFGKGGLPQVFIPNAQDLINNGILTRVNSITLR